MFFKLEGNKLHGLCRRRLALHPRCRSPKSNDKIIIYIPRQQCKRFCFLSSIISDCGCFHPQYLDTDDLTVKPCNLQSNSKILKKLFSNKQFSSSGNDSICVEGLMQQFDNGDRKCQCNPACFELDYEISLSSATWPAKQYKVC